MLYRCDKCDKCSHGGRSDGCMAHTTLCLGAVWYGGHRPDGPHGHVAMEGRTRDRSLTSSLFLPRHPGSSKLMYEETPRAPNEKRTPQERAVQEYQGFLNTYLKLRISKKIKILSGILEF